MSRRPPPISSDLEKLIPPPDSFIAAASQVLTESFSANDAAYLSQQMRQLAAVGGWSINMLCNRYNAPKIKKAFESDKGLTCSTNPDIDKDPTVYMTTLNIAWG